MGHEEHGGTWHMDAAQLDTQRKKGEAILKTSSTPTRPTGRVPQLDRPSFNSIELRSQQSNPKNAANSNVPTRVKPSVINLVTPVTAENSILPNQISHAIERPHLRVRVKSKRFPDYLDTDQSEISDANCVNIVCLARPNPDDQARIKRMLTDLINSQYDQKIRLEKYERSLAELRTIISPPPGTKLDSSPIYEPNSS
ncbi:unnamed protein product [Microthlaspi erraticum]|uniref:Uncharacterized protein n=1 Tax=Microthlaspi erraticum TaxID=1685480 RepID=A0A6D2IWW6_9BRAS|nr:unnamed protein product [Microthlaspi erraticum]